MWVRRHVYFVITWYRCYWTSLFIEHRLWTRNIIVVYTTVILGRTRYATRETTMNCGVRRPSASLTKILSSLKGSLVSRWTLIIIPLPCCYTHVLWCGSEKKVTVCCVEIFGAQILNNEKCTYTCYSRMTIIITRKQFNKFIYINSDIQTALHAQISVTQTSRNVDNI